MICEFKKDEEVYIYHYPVRRNRFLFKTRIVEPKRAKTRSFLFPSSLRGSNDFYFVFNKYGNIVPVKNKFIFKHGYLDNDFFWNKEILK